MQCGFAYVQILQTQGQTAIGLTLGSAPSPSLPDTRPSAPHPLFFLTHAKHLGPYPLVSWITPPPLRPFFSRIRAVTTIFSAVTDNDDDNNGTRPIGATYFLRMMAFFLFLFNGRSSFCGVCNYNAPYGGCMECEVTASTEVVACVP